ncbi:SDR family oxidoreductase [Paraferrimonas sp. SM1919]|uniref:SDR family oxidoreductase n=1 Tax=Paraferrimonas sp. SM1919 TaxID=2662263 RepID=UPI0013D19BDD|nr:SDR family oxidoreductase [Paraferrimonas sp. SM1919]
MNKVVLVTGGGRGIGAATAMLLAAEGYTVAVNFVRDRASAEGVVAAIVAAGGVAKAFQADVADEQQVAGLFTAVQAEFGLVTHLVNNAGVLAEQMPLKDMSFERFNRVVSTNINSAFLCCRAYLNQAETLSLNGGAIVNVSSAAAKSGSPFEYVDYAASKGAIDTLTRGLALELAEQGIRVNGVRPGFIDTDMHSDGGEPDRVARLADSIPLKRGGEALEVAEAIAWLLSGKASFTTGSFIDVAGGK